MAHPSVVHDSAVEIGATDDAGEYRSLSVLAVMSLVLGICSPAALTTPVLLAVPALGIGAGLLALRAIDQSAGGLAGRGLARAGIALSGLLLAAAIVRDPVRDRLMDQQADAAVRRWVELLASGKFGDARGVLSSGSVNSMLLEREPGSKPMPVEQIAEIVAKRLEHDPLTALAAQAAESKGTLRLEPVGESLPPEFTGPMTAIARTYRVISGSHAPEKYAQFSLRRVDGGTPPYDDWLIERWVLLDQPPAPTPTP